jgi:hypothetical protein
MHSKRVGMSDVLIFPRRGRGRPTPEATARYAQELEAFCAGILKIQSTLDFSVSSRGWCYILEEHGLDKGDFDKAQRLINDARKSGFLPVNICAEDESRLSTCWEELDDEPPETFAQDWVDALERAHDSYTPVSFWEYQNHYVEMLVEKIDLKTLFYPICGQYRVRIANARGWGDINGRAGMMRRFKKWEDNGKQCVLLYCGDHDPAGLNISDSLMTLFEEMKGHPEIDWNPSRLIIDRFGLNTDFIDDNGLTWIDGLETGSGEDLSNTRHADHNKPYVQTYLHRFGARKVEANALVVRAEQGRQLCRDAILKYIDQAGIVAWRTDLDDAREDARRAIAGRMAP